MNFFKDNKIRLLLFHILIIVLLKISHTFFSGEIIHEGGSNIERLIKETHGSWRYFVYDLNVTLVPLYTCLVFFFTRIDLKGYESIPDHVLSKYKSLVNSFKILPAGQSGFYIYDLRIFLKLDPNILLETFFFYIIGTILTLYIIKKRTKC